MPGLAPRGLKFQSEVEKGDLFSSFIKNHLIDKCQINAVYSQVPEIQGFYGKVILTNMNSLEKKCPCS